MLFVYGGIAAGLSLGEQGSSPGLDGRQKSSRDLSFWAAEAFFSEGSAFPLWLNRNERAPHAAQWRCQERVFFAGGFLDENPLARATIANSLKSLGSPAHFLRHSDFLGALGATAHALDHDHQMKLEMKPGMWAPGHSPPPRRRQLSSAADVDVP